MKFRHSPRNREFNTPNEMIARAVYLVCLTAAGATAVLTVVGTLTHRLALIALATIAAATAWFARDWLVRRRRYTATAAALDNFVQADAPPDPTQIGQLADLLHQWDALEQKRGSPDFDPWAVQAVRHDIQEIVEADPALGRLFHT